MAKCVSPLSAYICGTVVAKDGVKSPRLVFSYNEAQDYYSRIYGSGCACISAVMSHEVSVPCGKCYACLIRKRKDMSVRLSHEASCHERSCFITLTYNNAHVPRNNGQITLVPADVQKFIKRLRRYLEYVPKKSVREHAKIRYFAVGEYGRKTHRPHYHIMIFGWSPSDKSFFACKGSVVSYLSKLVGRLWPFGFSIVEDVSPHVAKYCARYVTKKITSDWTPDFYQVPEFVLMSKREGGIGAPWFDRYGADACSKRLCTYRCGDFICRASVPQYYWNMLRKRNQPLWIRCRDEKILWIKQHPVDNPEREFDDLWRSCDCHFKEDNDNKEKELF